MHLNKYQEEIKELKLDRTVIEKRDQKKEEKKARRKAKREQSDIKNELGRESEQNDGVNFTCTICANVLGISELSVKSDLEECDTCKACNVDVESESILSNTNLVDNQTESKVSTGAVNTVQYFWNGDLHRNYRLAIDYINMTQH